MTDQARLPILLWGDMRHNKSPVLRRAVAGWRAHECMYSWVYLTDYIALQNLKQEMEENPKLCSSNFFSSLKGNIWNTMDHHKVDPHSQINIYAFEAVSVVASIAAHSGESSPRIVELGSTFFASIDKYEIIQKIASCSGLAWDVVKPSWLGIDNSSFSNKVAQKLHADIKNMEIVEDYQDIKKASFSILYSRFVASYVFKSSNQFVDYVDQYFDALVVEDAFSTTQDDIATYNHGQPETFFSFTKYTQDLHKKGFQVYVMHAYPDFPAGTHPCYVIKHCAVKKNVPIEKVREDLLKIGIDLELKPIDEGYIASLNRKYTKTDWEIVKKSKRVSPVWGETNLEENNHYIKSNFLSYLRAFRRRFLLKRNGWSQYKLKGIFAEDEIERTLGDSSF